MIQPARRSGAAKSGARTAGRTTATSARPIQSNAVPPPVCDQPVQTPIGPTSPQVPMPEETAGPSIRSRKRHVATGPAAAAASVGGIQIRGLRTMLPICSIEVPRPCETSPPQPFSRKLIAAKPTICAQHPATAAPPARPVRPSAAQIAADEIGSVSAMPTSTDTAIPIRNGCRSVAHITSSPTFIAARPSAGASRAESARPTPIVASGVTRMSTFVSFETSLPHSAAAMATKRTASGPPAPPSAFEAKPTVTREKSTSGGALSAQPMAVAIAGPLIAIARPPTV